MLNNATVHTERTASSTPTQFSTTVRTSFRAVVRGYREQWMEVFFADDRWLN